jgi:outer membrane protein OmpA-like peptidoglycan-associated protein
MRQTITLFLLFTALSAGCASKNYVRQTVQPIESEVDQLTEQVSRQGTDLAQTRQDVANNTAAISAVDEKAAAADRRAGDALSKANEADQEAGRNSQEINAVREIVANLDNYSVIYETALLFGFDRAILTQEHKQQLDQVIARRGTLKRYFIAVEGYADETGPSDYNLSLSKRRAEAVIQYLAGDRDVDFNRIHTIGLGELRPADAGSSREAHARNRRVEVKIYSAEDTSAGARTAR